MIPQFPEFKKLELSDKEEVESSTRQYPPYSDFNFTSMWSWDVQGRIALSFLNGNLVLRFTDYISGEPFYTFLGTQEVDATARTLIELSKKEGLPPVLKMVPGIGAEALSKEEFVVEESPEHTDYLLSIDKLRTYEGAELASKRRSVSQFQRKHATLHFDILDVSNPEMIEGMKKLFALWLSNKDEAAALEEEHEFVAFTRCIESGSLSQLIATGVFADRVLVAFWLFEDLGNGHSISHFEKADTSMFQGIFPYLKQKTAHELHVRGVGHMNLEQDLGIEGLRANKQSYFPQKFLKKYSVSLRD